MIKKVRLTTTLAALKAQHPCLSGWERLLKSLPARYPKHAPINLRHILKSNGVDDMMWALRAATPDLPKLRVAICADMAARVLKHFQKRYPNDKRPRECIKACRQFVRGKISLATLAKAANAASAAADAPNLAANDVSTASVAAYAAADAAANAAANAAYVADVDAYVAANAANASAAAAADAASYAAYVAYVSAYVAAYAAADDAGQKNERLAQAKIIRKYLK